MHLTQTEADTLIGMPKRFASALPISFPPAGDKASYDLVSTDGREQFVADVNRAGKIKLTRCSYQNRYRVVVILLRLDLDGPPHTNPDGTQLPCPHLHVYREGYGNKCAVSVPAEVMVDATDLISTFRSFLAYCHVSGIPQIQGSL